MKPTYQDHDFGITTIDTAYLRPQLAASHLIVENGHAAFIDTGTNYSVEHLLAVLQDKNIPLEQVDYVIVTHVHLDHAGGAGQLIQQLPHAQLVVHPRGAPHLMEPSRLMAGVKAVYGEEKTHTLYGELPPIPAERVIQAGEHYELDFQGRTLLFLDTPGHARHHFCVWDEHSSSVFSGDTFGLSYRVFDTEQGAFIYPTTTPVQFDPGALHASIDRLMTLPVKQFFLTHYGKVDAHLQALADTQHQLIDEFVGLVRKHSDKGEQRHACIMEDMIAVLLSRLQAHGCQLPEAEMRDWLSMDVELNVQGLEFWWDKTQAIVS